MTNLTGVVRQLKEERDRVQGEGDRLSAALSALGSLGRVHAKGKVARVPKPRRPMSAAARRRIAAAQRARWAKWKAAKRDK